MVLTEIELREMWCDGRNPLPAFPPGIRFSPAAQDFIKDHRLEIQFETRPELPALAPNTGAAAANPQLPTTNDPLRASLDALHSLTMLTAAEARRYQLPALAKRVDGLAEYCLELRTAERQGRAPAPFAAPPASGAPNFVPGATDHAIVHWLNLLRATSGQVAAQAQAMGAPSGQLADGLRHLSDAAADLGRRVKTGELGWNSAMV
jgi:hypothetical protein